MQAAKDLAFVYMDPEKAHVSLPSTMLDQSPHSVLEICLAKRSRNFQADICVTQSLMHSLPNSVNQIKQ